MRLRELIFQVGLILLAIVLSKAFDFPFGYAAAAILAIAFIVQWGLQREEGEQQVELGVLFGGPIPWAERKPQAVKQQVHGRSTNTTGGTNTRRA
jgi:hypothetical protein